MKEPRYFYPGPEDLKIGLICEHLVSKNKWDSRRLERGDFMNYIPFSDSTLGEDSFIQRALDGLELLRVKELDHADLQELCIMIAVELDTEISAQYSGTYHDMEIVIIIDKKKLAGKYPYVCIYNKDKKRLFSGRLRSKQELEHIIDIVE
jgi:hypothetical protein